MNLLDFVKKLPEVGDGLIAKARRVEQLRQEAREIEAEVWATLNANWEASELAKVDPSLGGELDIDPAS